MKRRRPTKTQGELVLAARKLPPHTAEMKRQGEGGAHAGANRLDDGGDDLCSVEPFQHAQGRERDMGPRTRRAPGTGGVPRV